MNEISLNGNVFKYTNFLYGYQERFFKIENGNIFYYLTKESVKDGCRKYRQLVNFAIEMDESDSRRFDIVFPDERWCLRFKNEDEMIVWKNALRAFLPMPVSPVPNRAHSIDMHKLAIMSQNMDAQYEFIADFLDKFLGSQTEPFDLTTIEQTIDRCRQLEHNLKQIRAMLRLQQVKESIMSEDEWHDADDGDIQLDKEMINEIQKDLKTAQAEESKKQEALESLDPVPNPLYKKILALTADQVKYAKSGVDEGIWELFCEDGAMKMYKREMESEDGLMVDPLKAVHTVKGVSAKEYIDCFFKAEYKPEWDDTLMKITVVEKIDDDTMVLHQLHKKVWPAAQRESLFWTHFEDVSNQKDDDALDAYVVCNHNVDRDDVPLTDPSCVRVGLTIAMLCQTIVNQSARSKSKSELVRDDIQCRIYYVAQVHPGGWVPTAALRQITNSIGESVYESTFAFAHVFNPSTGASERFCVNHQPGVDLATSLESAKPVKLAWLTPKINETYICANGSTEFSEDVIVPIKYVTKLSGDNCLNDPDSFSYMNTQAKYLAKKGIEKTLLLVKKGEEVEVAPHYHKYLFSTFYNPELEEKKPDTYYMYWSEFFEKLLPLAGPLTDQLTGLEISFYKPKSNLPFDCSQLVVIGLAVFSIIAGSITGLKTLTDEDFKPYRRMESMAEEGALTDISSISSPSPSPESDVKENENKTENSEGMATIWQHTISVGTTLALIVGILVAAFFFRNIFIWFFNIFVLIFGTYSIYKCLMMLYCFERTKSLSLSMICCNFLDWKFLKKKFGFIDVFAFGFAGGFCITWFVVREEYYAFWFLDTINVALCVIAISNAVGIRNLKIITMVLCGMFVYDVIMVFGTRLITTNGCSVMLQVVTGDDCSSKTSTSNRTYPIAPLETDKPELMPVLFFVPLINDVMQSCYDMAVEREYRHIMLGLGDVIVPGYLICFCCFVDKIKASKIPYSVVGIVGYIIGLVATFLALRFMNTAQPALIYLVPFTLIPTVIKSVIQGHFKEIWNGTFKMDI